jgi:hypothetical protein
VSAFLYASGCPMRWPSSAGEEGVRILKCGELGVHSALSASRQLFRGEINDDRPSYGKSRCPQTQPVPPGTLGPVT